MTFTSHRLRLLAIPALLCASWLFDCRTLIEPFVALNQRADKAPSVKNGSLGNGTVPPPSLDQPLSVFKQEEDNAVEQALRGTVYELKKKNKTKIDNSDHDGDDEEVNELEWYKQNTAVQTLKNALSSTFTPEQYKLWFETPSFHPFPRQIDCPSPKKFVPADVNMTRVDFTDEQKKTLKRQLQKGSITIRKAFMPWVVYNNGFHPDLILHGGQVAGLLVGIFNGTLHFWGKQHSSAKVRLLAEHLESVTEAFHQQGIEIPDVIFPYTVRSIPPDSLTRQCAKQSAVPLHLQDEYDAVPAAGIAMDPTIHTGIALVPNMYFGNLQVWDRYTKQLLDGGKVDMPWNKRHQKVFWRGKIDKRLDANIARLEALQAAARDSQSSPRLLDITLTSGCDYLKRYASTVKRTSPLAPKWLPKDYFLNVTACGGYTRTPHAKFTNYWSQLNLPGSSLGSYSKNLQNLWPTGAAVMIWNQSAVEFYYDTLKTGITHVWVNETTIESMAEILFANEGKLAQLMGQVGREWFSQHLTSKAMLDYYQEWFHAWAALQRFIPSRDILPDPCTCAGWIDGDGKINDGIKRCSYCSSYPRMVKKECLSMMGTNSDPSICRR